MPRLLINTGAKPNVHSGQVGHYRAEENHQLDSVYLYHTQS